MLKEYLNEIVNRYVNLERYDSRNISQNWVDFDVLTISFFLTLPDSVLEQWIQEGEKISELLKEMKQILPIHFLRCKESNLILKVQVKGFWQNRRQQVLPSIFLDALCIYHQGTIEDIDEFGACLFWIPFIGKMRKIYNVYNDSSDEKFDLDCKECIQILQSENIENFLDFLEGDYTYEELMSLKNMYMSSYGMIDDLLINNSREDINGFYECYRSYLEEKKSIEEREKQNGDK